MDNKSRDHLYDFVKGILIYLMVYGHVLQTWSPKGTGDIIYVLIYTFHMPLFIFVSGYFAGRTLKMPLGSCVKKTWCHLLRPALIWTCVNFLCVHYFKDNGMGSKVINSMRSVWFLYCLAYLYIIGCCVWKLRHRYFWAMLIAVAGYAIYRLPAVAYIEYFQSIRQWPMFVLGLFYSEFKEKIAPPHHGVIILTMSLSCYILAILISMRDHQSIDYVLSHENYFFRGLIYFTGAIVVFVMLNIIYKPISHTCGVKQIARLGQNTMGIYVMNSLLIKMIAYILQSTFFPLWIIAIVITVILYGATNCIKRNEIISLYLLGN